MTVRPPARSRRGALLRAGLVAALAVPATVLPAVARAEGAAEAPTAVLDAVARHGVVVAFRFQKDLEAEATGATAPDPDAATEVFRRWRMSLHVPGFVVRDRRTVLVSDLFVAPGAIRTVEVEAADGTKVLGRVTAFLPRIGAVVVTTEADVGATPLEAPATAEPTAAAEPAAAARLFSASLTESADGIQATAEALRDAEVVHRTFGGGPVARGRVRRPAAGLGGTSVSRTAELLVDAAGAPAGLRFDGPGLASDDTWRLAAVLADLARAVPFAALVERKVAAAAESYVHAVRLVFRARSVDDDLGGTASFLGATPPPEPDPDARHWGLAVAPDVLVVPTTLPASWVARLQRVTVEERGGIVHEARYEGRVPDLGAFVVRLVEARLDPMPAAQPPAPPPHHALLIHRTAWRAGARRDGITYDRSLGTTRGYGDRRFLATEGAVEAGTVLLDLEGQVLGFSADLQPDDAERVASRGGGDDGLRGVVAALFADLGAPASLADGLDRRVMPAASRAARRLPWLGVELEPLRGPAVADALDIAGPTRDGTRGLVVNHVYAGSPAERAGVKVDDVILSARRTSGPGADAPPVDLKSGPGGADWPDASDAMRPWTPRMNPLVRLLQGWGEGTTYVLEVLRDDALVETGSVVETGPADASTAEEAYDQESGLAVKELTYEVRAGLRLAKDAPGALISAVDDGSAGQQARILMNEVLLELDGKPVDGPKGFARAIVEARMSGRREVRMVVLRLDRTRFVDVRIANAPPTPSPGPR